MALTKITKPVISDSVANSYSFRNLIINGDMNIHQRGSSVSGITNNTLGAGQYYTADRIRTTVTSPVGTWTQTVEVDAPSGTGLNKSVKVTCTTANNSLSSGSNLNIGQNFEGQNLQILKKGTPNAESFTISFWVKSNVVGTYICDIFDFINSRQISRSYTINSVGVWEKKVITVPGDTIGTIPNDNNVSLYLNFFLGQGSSFTSGTLNTSWNSNVQTNRAVGQINLAATVGNYFQITGIQMEIGVTASPFEVRPIGLELSLCQRYYNKSYNVNLNPGTVTNSGYFLSFAHNTFTLQQGNIRFPVVMRGSQPTCTLYSSATGAANRAYDVIGVVDTVTVAINSGNLGFEVSGNGNFIAGRYYAFHYAADSEL